MELENKLMDALVYGNVKQIEKVFEEIYQKYYKLVYYTIKQYVELREDIEDLIEDTFVSFYNSLDRNTKITFLKALLCKIAKNHAIDFVRKSKITMEEMKDDSYVEVSSTYQEDLFDFLKSKLNENEYYILIHHSVYEETFQEIASDLKASLNTIKSTYRRLLKKLKGEHYENFR